MTRTIKYAAYFASMAVLTFATGLRAGNSIPAGTVIPARLDSTLSSAKSKPGQIIRARIMQDVPLSNGSTIHAGDKAIGHIVSVTPASKGSGASISFRFDTLKTRHGKVPIATDLRAIASFVAVEQAQVPVTGPDRGTSESAWTTVQIGGDAVYRGGGPVESFRGKVGEPVYGGVLSRLTSNPGRGCRAAVDANGAPQALWVFSSNACGTYSLPNLKIRHAGRTNPVGEIALDSGRGQVTVQSGSGMLLRVNVAGANGA